MRSKDKPILLVKQSEDSYLDPEAPIYLLPNGNIQCGNVIYKSSALARHQYPFIRDYLKKKRLPFDINNFSRKELIDVIEEMKTNKKNSISLNKLLDIVSYRNQITAIKDYKIRQIKQIAYSRFWREIKKLSVEKKYGEVAKLHKQLREKQQIVHKLINNEV